MLALHSTGIREVLSHLVDFIQKVPGLSLCQCHLVEWFGEEGPLASSHIQSVTLHERA